MQVEQWRKAIGEMVRDHMRSPELEYYFSVKMNKQRAQLMITQLGLYIRHRRDCWSLVSANCPVMVVKQAILRHEFGEVIKDQYSEFGHLHLIIRQAEKLGLTAREVVDTQPLLSTTATLYAWAWLTHAKSWVEGLSALTVTEWTNDDRLLNDIGGGHSTRMADAGWMTWDWRGATCRISSRIRRRMKSTATCFCRFFRSMRPARRKNWPSPQLKSRSLCSHSIVRAWPGPWKRFRSINFSSEIRRMLMEKPRIRHIAINVADREKTAEYYKKVFGMEEKYRGPGGTIYLSDGHLDLALISTDKYPRGINHFGFQVDSVKGIEEVAQTKAEENTFGAVAESWIKDAEGNRVDVSEHGWPI